MKVIDLLNKIAKGEELPQYIEYRNWNNNSFEKMLVCKENLFYKLDQLEIYLNDEIEIIEEKGISKMVINEEFLFSNSHSGNMRREDRRLLDSNFKEISNKINEIIDYLLEKESDK